MYLNSCFNVSCLKVCVYVCVLSEGVSAFCEGMCAVCEGVFVCVVSEKCMWYT